jgi:hypothetical protein
MPKSIRDKYFEQFAANLKKALEITTQKNKAYTAALDDPFSNFRFASLMATFPSKEPISVEQTILSRIGDKVSRYKSLVARPDFTPADESMLDTLHDWMVYVNILLTWEQLGRPSFDTLFDDDDLPETQEGTGIAAAGKALAKLFNWPPSVTK